MLGGISCDVTARRTVLGQPNDPEMGKLLAYLLTRNADTAGERSRAIELAIKFPLSKGVFLFGGAPGCDVRDD